MRKLAARPLCLPRLRMRATPVPFLTEHERRAEADALKTWLRAARLVARGRGLTEAEGDLVRRVRKRLECCWGRHVMVTMG